MMYRIDYTKLSDSLLSRCGIYWIYMYYLYKEYKYDIDCLPSATVYTSGKLSSGVV